MGKGNFTQGKWESGKGEHFQSLDPANNSVVWEGRESTAEDVDEAVQSAAAAQEEWAELPLVERKHILSHFTDLLDKKSQSLAKAISQEVGKPLWEAKTEVAAMIGKLGISVEAQEKRCPTMESDLPAGKGFTRHKPHGVVAVFGPYNFPAHLPNGHIIPALLAGNAIVFKPSEHTPLVGEKTVEIWESAGLPSGVLNLVQGSKNTGHALVQHPLVRGIFFTGSSQTGQILQKEVHPGKIIACEMGGNNPLIVWNAEDSKACAYTILQSSYLTSGQRCTCARRLILEKGESGQRVLDELISLLSKIKVDHYSEDPEPFMGPVISHQAAQGLLQKQEALKELGGLPLLEMYSLKENTGLLSPGLMDCSHIENLPDEELFGPFLQVRFVDSFPEAIKEANRTEYGLSAGILSDEKLLYETFYQKARAGIINWNTQITGASSKAPFGGPGLSGNYRPGAYYAADYCNYPVASIESDTLTLPETLCPGIYD